MQKILVTGAAGFIGRYVAREYASKGHTVVGLGWGSFPDASVWGVSEWQECDIFLESLLEFAGKPDVIIHCAGGASVGNSIQNPRQDFSMTVDSTSQLLEFIRCHSPGTRLLYPSTAAVYGQAGNEPISEQTAVAPVSPYGVHKVMAEDLCQMYAGRYGLSVAVVRLFSIYGVGLRKQLLWDACNKLKRNGNGFFGTGEEQRDWLHVTDAARLLWLVSRIASSDCPVINGGSGTATRVRHVLEKTASMLDRGPVLFTAVPKSGDPDTLVADVTRARGLGWEPVIGLEAGLREYVEWFKECQKSE